MTIRRSRSDPSDAASDVLMSDQQTDDAQKTALPGLVRDAKHAIIVIAMWINHAIDKPFTVNVDPQPGID
jgi:hypothetical protein